MGVDIILIIQSFISLMCNCLNLKKSLIGTTLGYYEAKALKLLVPPDDPEFQKCPKCKGSSNI
jgi:hypothetical protein